MVEEDVYNYALNEGIKLLNYETKVIYTYIKNYWEVLLNGDPTFIFEELKNEVRKEVYDKLIIVYNKYKRQFK